MLATVPAIPFRLFSRADGAKRAGPFFPAVSSMILEAVASSIVSGGTAYFPAILMRSAALQQTISFLPTILVVVEHW